MSASRTHVVIYGHEEQVQVQLVSLVSGVSGLLSPVSLVSLMSPVSLELLGY